MKSLILLLLVFSPFSKLLNDGGKSVEETKTGIEWISLAEAHERMQSEPRKIVVDVYTNWCGWCKRMDRETFANQEVIEFVNANFYAVKLNAESQDAEVIKGESMTHQSIARQFQVRGYPTIVVINEDFKTYTPYPGYKDAKAFLKMLDGLKTKS
jgi:thioredoxin-related protein